MEYNRVMPDEELGEILRNVFGIYSSPFRKYAVGTAENSIWGRKFKVRITSNNTGRKIDFNLIFDITKTQSEENLE